ncbi:restriction endonuclease subunit S [Endozoicomonas euniceicola]|uniref:Restriction endonuclease subunit S n=1 Tax=Endozoicomonas euniceicola TaxID=1234143 RepID=A0ABY6GY10_9GAMM|nr:restriction endonuclease subunit S [Endozoicomonas euniceicola]UYM17676.1 restriction endonuclease subunit S [Endozoicomonas euniceicola]
MKTSFQYPKYDTYKDSGVPWLGDIPEHWNVTRNLGLFKERKEINQPEMELLAVTIKRGVIKQSEITTKKDSSNDDKSKYKVVRRGDLAYNKMRMWQGAIGESKYDGIVSPAYIILNTKNKLYSRYFHYLYRTGLFIKEANRHSYGLCDDMNSLRYEDFKTIYSPAPPEQDVSRIIDFLDLKTAEIDAAIAKKQELIQLLNEQKAILLNRAVTKGLNPDVKMKDTGIAWLGEVPEHWEVRRFKYCARVTSGQVDPRKEPHASLTLIAPNHIESSTGKILKLETAKEQGADSGKYLVEQGDLIYSKIRPALRKACISPVKALCSADMYVLKTKSCLRQRFLLWFIMTNAFTTPAINAAMRVAMPKVNREALGDFPLLIAPLKEQDEILEYIDNEFHRIDEIVNSTKKSLVKLQEFKQTLITHTTTGKIKV